MPGAARRRRAHPHATSSATCARSTRAGCSTAATRSRACTRSTQLMAMKRSGDVGPRLRPRARPAAVLPRAPVDADVAVAELPGRSPDVATDNPVFTPPFVGARVVKGLSLDDIAEYVNETALFRNQWQFRPETRADGTVETDDEFKARIRPMFRAAAGRGQGVRRARAAGGLRLLPGQRRRRRPRRVDRRVAHRRGGPLPLPAPEASRRSCASPTSSGPIESGEARLRRVPHRHDGRRGQRGDGRACSPPTSTRSTCCCTASASRWPRRWPSTGTAASATEWGFVDEDGPTHRRAVPPAVPRRPLLVGLPGLPRPRGQRHRRPRCSAPSASASRSARRPAGSTSPSRPPRRSSATTRRPSTSSPAELPAPRTAASGAAVLTTMRDDPTVHGEFTGGAPLTHGDRP